MSKVFEKVMFDQINLKMKDCLSNNLCGYRKGFSTQHAIILMIENGEKP